MCDHGPFGKSVRGGFNAISLFLIPLYWLSAMFFTTSMHAQQKDDPQGYRQRSPTTPASSAVAAVGTKIAQGEYAIIEQANGGAYGPFREEVYDFHESWTIWRTENGEYRVEGERKFESPKDVPHTDRFTIDLSRDMTIDRTTEFARLKFRRDSGPLSCEFSIQELHCSSSARDPRRSIDLHIPMQVPLGFLWPISPFSLGGLTKQAERNPNGTAVQLLSLEQPSAAAPLSPMVLSGQLQYLGEENIEAAGQTWSAHKFSLKVPLHPQFLIWTSPRGLLLALAIEHPHPNWPQEGMRLVSFKKWAEFDF